MMTYSVSLSSSSYPSMAQAMKLYESDKLKKLFENKSLSQAEKYQLLKNNVVSLNIYYETLSYTSIDQSAKTTIIDLISNIGKTILKFFKGSCLIGYLIGN